MLLYKCEQLIVDFDFEQGFFSFIDREELFKAQNINEARDVTIYLADLFALCVSILD